MPINPEIPLSVGRGVTPLSPMKSIGQGALAAQGVLQAVQQRLANRGLTLEQAHKQMTWGANQMAAMLSQPGGPTFKGISKMVTDAINEQMMTPKEGASLISSFAGLDGPQIRHRVRQMYSMAQNTANAVAPHIGILDQGPNYAGVNTNPLAPGGAGREWFSAMKGLTPGEASSIIQYTGPEGQTITTTRGAILNNGDRLPYAGEPLPNKAPVPGARKAGMNGPSNSGSSGVVESPTPGEITLQKNTAAFNADLGNKWIADAQRVPQALAALQGIKAFAAQAHPGELNSALSKFSNVMAQVGMKGFGDLATSSGVTQKEMSQLVMQQAGSMGVPTDSKMSLTTLGNPHMTLTLKAMQTTTGLVEGQQLYIKARAEAWMNAQDEPGMTASKFQAEWNKSIPNADVFQFGQLPDYAKQRFWTAMNKKEKQSFSKSAKWAAQHGLLDMQTLMQ